MNDYVRTILVLLCLLSADKSPCQKEYILIGLGFVNKSIKILGESRVWHSVKEYKTKNIVKNLKNRKIFWELKDFRECFKEVGNFVTAS